MRGGNSERARSNRQSMCAVIRLLSLADIGRFHLALRTIGIEGSQRMVLRIFAAILLVAPSVFAVPELPAFREDATDVHDTGRLIWADLFTAEVEREVQFYSELFGWDAKTLEDGELSYTLLRNNGKPIAGVVHRPASEGATATGIWIPYLSTATLEETLTRVSRAGGRIEVPNRTFPKRGSQSIIRDTESALVGLMESSTGDPDDVPGEVGEFVWAQFYARDLQAAIEFYTKTLGYETEDRTVENTAFAYLFKEGDTPRASLSPIPENRPEASPGWLGCIRVANINDTLAKVESLDGEVIWGPDPEVMKGRIAVMADPAGAALIVVEFKEDAQNNE